MIETFLLPVTTALLWFPVVVLLVILPVAVLSYRRRGRAGGWTTLVVYGFLFYLLAAALQTVIPLPSNPNAYCATQTYASTPQLRPFYFVEVVSQRARGDWSPAALLRNAPLMSTVLNVVLLAPLGFFLRYVGRVRFLAATAIGFGVSLLFELSQLTGLWGIYPCAYRLFSVDDLMLNTVGAALGWGVAAATGRFLPELDHERERLRYGGRVTPSRRLFALLTDVVGCAVLIGFVLGLIILFGGTPVGKAPVVAVLAGIWFLAVPMVTGTTLGKRAMLLRIGRTDGRPAGPLSVLVRNGVLFSPVWLGWIALQVEHWSVFERPSQLLIPLGLLVSGFVVGIWSPLAVFFGDDRAPYERLSRTVNVAVSSRAERSARMDSTMVMPSSA
ncbi:MAG TPA: VanZ family protein [Actinophytocola sp.]|uniref:VanZ family protein n=1 Tax=Actinophytocola sp. TaxID=1872138 RepID=UPI002DBAB67B|nr:VanZ family protein [Actinophytocola sp.]HEU5475601.1 VanZ family protein [Actinophytocola sp.]